MSEQAYWRKCGSCKKEIGFNTIYQACNVSTCRKLVFCTVDCWNLHNPVMNHKSSWAEENRSPKKEEYRAEADSDAPRRIIVSSKTSESKSGSTDFNEEEILIVASKLKQYVKDRYDMNTSANVMEALSRIVRRQTDQAIGKARSEGRKTLMDRDFE
ncbi:MAG: hypothetical protein K2Q18_05590 [Bdellovibrionales bacterium]|nr:hypothetical protein [Bdellovibrionales bacterium]